MAWVIIYTWMYPQNNASKEGLVRYRKGRGLASTIDDADLYTFATAYSIVSQHRKTTLLAFNIRTTMEDLSLDSTETLGSGVRRNAVPTENASKTKVRTKGRPMAVGGKRPRIKKDPLLSNYNAFGDDTFKQVLKRSDYMTDEVLLARIDLMQRKRTEELRLKNPFPSPPFRNPKYCIKAYVDGELKTVFTYCEMYAAHVAVNLLIRDEDYKWINSTTLKTESGRKIVEPHLEDIMEYELSETEKKWIMPEPEYGHLTGQPLAALKRNLDEIGVLPQERKPRAERTGSLRKAKAGELVPSDLAKMMNTTPERIRDALRKSRIEKPYVWDAKEAEDIMKQIKAKLKK